MVTTDDSLRDLLDALPEPYRELYEPVFEAWSEYRDDGWPIATSPSTSWHDWHERVEHRAEQLFEKLGPTQAKALFTDLFNQAEQALGEIEKTGMRLPGGLPERSVGKNLLGFLHESHRAVPYFAAWYLSFGYEQHQRFAFEFNLQLSALDGMDKEQSARELVRLAMELINRAYFWWLDRIIAIERVMNGKLPVPDERLSNLVGQCEVLERRWRLGLANQKLVHLRNCVAHAGWKYEPASDCILFDHDSVGRMPYDDLYKLVRHTTAVLTQTVFSAGTVFIANNFLLGSGLLRAISRSWNRLSSGDPADIAHAERRIEQVYERINGELLSGLARKGLKILE